MDRNSAAAAAMTVRLRLLLLLLQLKVLSLHNCKVEIRDLGEFAKNNQQGVLRDFTGFLLKKSLMSKISQIPFSPSQGAVICRVRH